MNFSENEFRDFLFENYKENLADIIIGKRDPVVWDNNNFPPIQFLLQQIAEKRINEMLEGLNSLTITGKELRLEKNNDSTTRVDLFGNSESAGLTIIELKKSEQTERQSFTELLAYSNHFCSVFPGLTESSFTSILIAPMKTRIVRDSYAQELILNKKNILAFIPKEENGNIFLEVYYPDKSHYEWFENNLFDDKSMLTVAVSFPLVEGWIDSDLNTKNQDIPDYSKEALNTISSTISHKLESLGFHGLVYASQKWGELAEIFPYPNTILAVAVNPFASFKTSIHEDEIYGESENGRIHSVQSIYNQLCDDEKSYWIENMESAFHDYLIRTVREEFELCFLNNNLSEIRKEISLPHWSCVKTLPTESGTSYNLDVFLTGLIREIYLQYINYVYLAKEDLIFYNDALPGYSYNTFRDFLPVWEIFSGIGLLNTKSDDLDK